MNITNTNQHRLIMLFTATVLFFCFSTSFAQSVLPQRTLTVKATQGIHFGTICLNGGAGGTVTVGYDGTRTSTGNLILLSMAPIAQPAIFEIKLCQGRNVCISYNATTTLTGENGGTLILKIGPTEKGANGARFMTNNDCDFITQLRVGGTLDIPGTAIPGNYTGDFVINFNQQ